MYVFVSILEKVDFFNLSFYILFSNKINNIIVFVSRSINFWRLYEK